MDNTREVLLHAIKDINERLDEIEKPKNNLSNFIGIAGLGMTLIAGFASTMFISVSKITTLEIRSQYINENMIELKNEVAALKQKLDNSPKNHDTK